MIGTQLRNRIRFFADKIYSQLGPGFSERVYHNAMEILLRKDSIPYESGGGTPWPTRLPHLRRTFARAQCAPKKLTTSAASQPLS